MAVANIDTSAEVDIWIAKGTYTPIDGIASLPADRSDTSFTFYRGNGVGKALKIYGGFAGSETSIAARDTNHTTYLDGKISGHANSYHVITIAGLSLNADSVILDCLTIRNGTATYDGGASRLYNGITVYRNWGGGIVLAYNNSAKLIINNCKIRSNTMNGGYGAGLYIVQSSPIISNCYFDSNINTGYSGGAIFMQNSSTLIINSKFTANAVNAASSGPQRGGAIANLNSQLKIENCIFIGNSIRSKGVNEETYGGAIYNEGRSDTSLPAPEINNCSFISNSSVNLDGNAYGAGIYNLYYSTVITNCIFTGNLVYSSASFSGYGSCGGGVFNLYSSPVITNCVFTSNISRCYNGTASASAAGGAIYNYYSPQTITNCTFTSDSADVRADVSDFSNSTGGAVFNTESAVTFDKCIFNSNVANRDTAGIGIGMGGSYGGGVYNTASFYAIHFHNCTFKNNSALNGGGAIGADNCNEIIGPGNVFSNNKAMSGGAIWQESSLDNCNGNIFVGNRSMLGGGAIRTSAYPDTLFNNVFINNKDSSTGGGALELYGGPQYLVNNTFYADSAIAGGLGGAIQFVNAANGSVVVNNIFYKNYGASTTNDTSLWPGMTDTFANNTYSGTDPKFVNEADLKGSDSIWGTHDDGLELQACSPARNNGSNAFVVGSEITDITGAARIESSTVDIGAYETTPIPEAKGPRDICIGYTILLSDSIKGGAWMSKDTSIATIDSTGLVKSVAIGSDTILYIVKGSCSTDTLYTLIRVNSTSTIGPITGITTVCPGATITLSDSITGGSWTATNGNATVHDGIVAAIKSGIDTITYTNGCHAASTSTVITILSSPDAGIITGLDTLCVGKTTLFTDTVAGGKWSSSNKFASVLSAGLVAGNSSGKDTIIYTVTGTTCKSEATKSIYIMDCRTLVKNVSSANAKMDIYPNPNRGTFTINIASEKDENIRVSITDITGKKVNDFNIATNKPATIKLNQPAGLYFLSANTKDGRYNAKIIVE